jgi:hypothetical protein
MSTLSTLIQHRLGIPSQSKKTGRIKGIQVEKKEVRLFIWTDDMILYLKDLKNTIKKLLDIMNTFSKVAGYKINLQKSVVFLYTNNE